MFFLLTGVATILAAAAVAYLLLTVAQWLGGSRAVWAVGILLCGAIAFEIFDVLRTCDAPPVITPSQCDAFGKCASEMATFACDGPGGAFIYAFGFLILPAAAIAIGVMTRSVARRASKPSVEA